MPGVSSKQVVDCALLRQSISYSLSALGSNPRCFASNEWDHGTTSLGNTKLIPSHMPPLGSVAYRSGQMPSLFHWPTCCTVRYARGPCNRVVAAIRPGRERRPCVTQRQSSTEEHRFVAWQPNMAASPDYETETAYVCFRWVVSYSAWSHGLNCRPAPCEGVPGAMLASRVACKVVWFIVRQRQLHASPPTNELSWLLEPKFLATPEMGSSQSRFDVYISRQRVIDV